ncbi:hypothetical protein [Ferrovibrio sp.]|uniref:hypothetical protein n=1 Tax=Ferrovibrio sp. TaxID=1917215 RepID=UPI00311D5300
MSLLLLTAANCDFVKRELRQALPQVGSGHLTEALAFALGFRTHAALRPHLTPSTSARPPLVAAEPSRLGQRLLQLGEEIAPTDHLTAILQSDDMPDRIWCEYAQADRVANDLWFRECERRNIPNIYIQRHDTLADLHWDCWSIDSDHDAHVQGAHGDAMLRELYRCYQALVKGDDPGKSEFFGSGFVGSIARLDAHIARQIAGAYFWRLYTPMHQQMAAA